RSRHTRCYRDWSSDVCSSDLAVAHALRLAEGGSDGARIQMVPSDHDRRTNFAVFHQVVQRATELRALPLAEPADARRQPLEGDRSKERRVGKAWSARETERSR